MDPRSTTANMDPRSTQVITVPTSPYTTTAELKSPATRQITKILFIGNSLTYVNDLPRLLDAFTKNTDHPTQSTFKGAGGLSLGQHLAGTTEQYIDGSYYRKYDNKTLNEIRTGKYKYVIIHDQSSGLDVHRTDNGLSRNYKFMINSCINKTDIIKEGWPGPDGIGLGGEVCSWYDGTKPGFIGENMCTSDGNYSNNWKRSYGSFESFKYEGVTALDVCCGCGGGTPALLPKKLDVSELFSHITYESGSIPVFMKPATPIKLAVLESVYKYYDTVAETYKTMLADCGAAIEDIKHLPQYNNNTLYTDGTHPTKFSQFLSACVIYNTLFDEKSENVPYKPSGIKKTDSDKIKSVADTIVSNQRTKYKDLDTIRVFDNDKLSGSTYESIKVPSLDNDGNPTVKTFTIPKVTKEQRDKTFNELPTDPAQATAAIITNTSIPNICKQQCDSGSGHYRTETGSDVSCVTHAAGEHDYTLCPTYASHCSQPCGLFTDDGECKKLSTLSGVGILCAGASASGTCKKDDYSYCPNYMFPKPS